MDLGVFIPIGSNGWLISTTSPRYRPSFALNRDVVQKAEAYGFEFALSMVKLRGFGGESEFWDHCLESFTLMAALAAVTTRIKLFASAAVLTLPPAIAARMASTIDSVAPGRFGINIVSGWQQAEYSQMGLWPGKEHFDRRYQYCAEYVQVIRDLTETGACTLDGDYFKMDDCRLSPLPSAPVKIVAAGQSGGGMAFAAQYADYNFCMGEGVNTPTKFAGSVARLVDAAAQAKWELYEDGNDALALGWMGVRATADETGSYVRGQERGGPWTRRADQNGELTARSCPAPADAD
jgi:pyrimidine oxygenase